MCYVILLSTSSDEDLTRHNSDLVRFSRELPDDGDVEKLNYPHRWYLGSKAGCSCTFRHLYSIELGFGEPVYWYEEAPDEIAATLEAIAVIRRMVDRGDEVDCLDAWPRENLSPAVMDLDVDLSKVADAEFRFFENHHFVFRSTG
jgi:hypothetical protein